MTTENTKHSRSRCTENKIHQSLNSCNSLGLRVLITCTVFLDPYIKIFLFVNSLGRSGVCVCRTVGPNSKFSLFRVCQKWKISSCSNFWPVWAMCEEYCRCQNDRTELSLWIFGSMGRLAAIFVWIPDFQISNILRSENDRQVSHGTDDSKTELTTPGAVKTYLTHRIILAGS